MNKLINTGIFRFFLLPFILGGLLFCFSFLSIVPALADGPMNAPPHNDPKDRSVYQVMAYLQTHSDRPNTLTDFKWGSVGRLKNGKYRVIVSYREQNRFGRTVTRRRLFFLDIKGKILRVIDMR